MTSRTPQAICEALLNDPLPPERERLLEEAAHEPECLALLMTQAQHAAPADPQTALRGADLAVEVARRLPDAQGEAGAWRLRAQVLRTLGRHADALPAFEAAADCAHAAADPRLEAQVQIGRVDSLGWLGRYDEAITLAKDLVGRLQALGAKEDAARVLVNLGSVHFRRDQYQDALNCYEDAAVVLDGCDDPVARARVQTNSANILTQLARMDEAQALYQQARGVFLERQMASIVAMIDANIGFLHYLSGEYTAALASLTRARQEFAARNQQVDRAKCDADLADVYRMLNLLPEALESYEQAIDAFARAPLDYERGKAELGRAGVLSATERYAEAEQALDLAEQIFKAQKNRVQQAHLLLMRALLQRSQGDEEGAVKSARSAVRCFSRCKLPAWTAEARLLLSELALNQTASPSASLIRTLSAAARTARRHARGWIECRAERALGLCYARRGRQGVALRHLRAAVETLEAARTLVAPEEMHVAFLRDKLGVYEQLIDLLLERGRPEDVAEAFQCVERAKSRLLLERVQASLEQRLDANDAESDPLRIRLAALRKELSRGYHRLQAGGPEDARRLLGVGEIDAQTLVPLENAYRKLLREIEFSQRPPDVLVHSTVISTERLRSALKPDEALIEFTLVHDVVCAFVLTRDGLKVRRNLAQSREVQRLARRLRYHLQKAGIECDYVTRHLPQMVACTQEVLAQLYDLLMRPLLDLIPHSTVERIILAPHGVLHGLPFHAFYDGERPSLDRWEFLYAPSAAVWYAGVMHAPSNPSRRSALIMGVPGPGIERVTAEVEHLARILPSAECYCGDKATLETFRQRAGHCRLIHLAAHALFRADNPLFSGLRFADGWLLARDLYELRLDCDLAVLSACRTGVADVEAGDELFGLTRGFLSAGARSLAVSLWPADDRATADLMTLFYTLMSQGVARAAALRAAQQAMRREYPHPYHWAAFALMGER